VLLGGADTNLAASTVKRYNAMLLLFNNALWVTGGTSLRPLLEAAEVQAMAIFGTLFLQMGYDSGLFGLGDAGNFLAGLKRILEEANVNIPGAVFSPDSVLQPLRRIYSRWKELEPYEFKLPVAEEVAIGLCGFAVATQDFELLLYVMIGFHGWVRPQELSAMLWEDLVLFSDGDVAFSRNGVSFGVIRIRSPKMWKITAFQHVLIELRHVRDILQLLKRDLGRLPTARIFTSSSVQFRRKWDAALQHLGLGAELSSDNRLIDRKLTPGGLRAGGSTADYLCNGSLSRCQWLVAGGIA
jgi:hypothetical protein